MTFEEYKQQLLDYLQEEKELTEQDIQDHKDLSDDEKVEQGYLIKECLVSTKVDDCYELTAKDNNTKLRTGDRVKLTQRGNNTGISATVVENRFTKITITTTAILDENVYYDIHVAEAVLLDPLITLMEEMEDGGSGSFYLKELCEIEKPDETGYGAIDASRVDIPSKMDAAQQTAIENVLKRPSLYCIQGPPGTGKTDVLSVIAKIFSENGKEVLVISNTHQAVNNALNKIAQYSVPVAKIGETLKAQDLSANVQRAKTYSSYLKSRKKQKRGAKGAVVGMTLHAAIINLGLRSSGFSPTLVLVDEAG